MLRNVVYLIVAVLAVLAIVQVARAQDKKADALVAKITAALPETAPAKPAKARKILVYGHCNGFNHGGAIKAAKIAFPLIGEKTGAFTAVVSDDPTNFEADKLKEFDAVVLSNITGEMLMGKALASLNLTDQAEQAKTTERLRKNLMEWVKAGHGVVGIHAATDCSYKWKDYGEMLGGYFSGHPWNQDVPIKIDDPTNPINAAFEGKGFSIKDEIYQFNRGVYSRERQRVLLSLDMDKLTKKGGRKDNDYAISWVKPCGNGRVFYCSLGHHEGIFTNPAVLKHYLAGLQWALGDLTGVDTTPNPLPAAEKKD